MKDLENYTIGATDGDIGQVKDFYFDDHTWVIRYLIVDTGSWLSSRKVLISPISIHQPDWTAQRLPVAITREQVRNSPDIDTDRPVSRQHEMKYLGYYGYPYYWNGDGIWGGGMFPYSMFPGYAGRPGARAEQEQAIEESANAEQARQRDDDPHLRSCKAIIDYHIHATDGEVGHVEDVLVDEQTWAIRYFVVNTSNWWVGHKVLIAPQWISGIDWSDRSVVVDLSRESVKAAPPYESSAELNPDRESLLFKHYGRTDSWARGASIDREI
jgi:uncharacterized protein YrrD